MGAFMDVADELDILSLLRSKRTAVGFETGRVIRHPYECATEPPPCPAHRLP